MSLSYALHTKKYGEKLYSNLVIMNMKKAISYDFTLNNEQTTIDITNIEDKNVLPKTLMEVIYSFMINEILLEYKTKHKMDDNDFVRLSSMVYDDNDVRGNQYFLLIELNEWLNNNEYFNLDNLIDFKLRRFKNFLKEIILEIFETEKEDKKLMEKVKELEEYTTKVFTEKYGLEKFEKLIIRLDEKGNMFFETNDGLVVDLPFIQDTLGLIIHFTDENEPLHDKSEVILAVKIFQFLIATLGVNTIDITEIEDKHFELTLICNVFYSMCASFNRVPTIINRNFLNTDTDTDTDVQNGDEDGKED